MSLSARSPSTSVPKIQRPEDYMASSNVPLSFDLSGAKRLVGPLQATQNFNTASEPIMSAFYDAATLRSGLKLSLTKSGEGSLEKTSPAFGQHQAAAVTFEIFLVLIAIDSIYGTTTGLGSARFWLILQQ
jgi:hypothetical protein